jgi:hypothetical protein
MPTMGQKYGVPESRSGSAAALSGDVVVAVVFKTLAILVIVVGGIGLYKFEATSVNPGYGLTGLSYNARVWGGIGISATAIVVSAACAFFGYVLDLLHEIMNNSR